VKNQGAFLQEFGALNIPNFKTKQNGINPPIFGRDPEDRKGEKVYYNDNNLQFFNKTAKNGQLKNILLNIDLLLGIYREIKSSDYDNGVVMVDYIKSVMHKVSTALGGLNNFIVSTAGPNQNTAKLVDTYYLNKQPKDTFYEFDLLGLGSICKNVDIESQIFENQSTIVGIAAQSKANLGDVYNSSQVYLNAGLTDRLSTEKGQGEEINGKKGNYFKNNKNSSFYRKVLQLMVYARDYIVGTGGNFTSIGPTQSTSLTNLLTGDVPTSKFLINQNDRSLSTPSTLLKQSLLRFDGDLGFKALIPFKLRITLEGIGGIVVGQIFRIKQNVIPKNYYDKNLGFVITQINHSLKDNQWETTLETQICILEDKKFENFITQDRGGFEDFVEKLKAIAILYPILIDFIKFQTVKSLIGYLYATTNNGTFTKNIDDYLLNYKKDDVTKYWENNIQGFLEPSTPPSNSFPIGEFENFVKSWVNNWLSIYGNEETSVGSGVLRKDVEFTTGKTVEATLNWIASNGFPAGIASEEVFEGFNQDFLYKTNEILTSNYGLFYPNGKGSFFGPPVTSVINKNGDFYTLNNQVLTDNIKNFLNTASDRVGDFPFQLVKEAYNASFGLGEGQFSLSQFFFIDSYVMYGQPTSLGHPLYDNQKASAPANNYNHIWWLEKNMQPTNPNIIITSAIHQTFGRKINWTSTYLYIDPQTNQQSRKTIDTERYGNNVTPAEENELINNGGNYNIFT
jgi:hypothetical protein